MSFSPDAEEELFTRYVQMGSNGDDSWYGTKLLPGSVDGSEANRHYQECCKGPPHDFEDATGETGMESDSELVHLQDEDMVRQAMEAALRQYDSIDSTDFHSCNMSQDARSGFRDWFQLCEVLS